jgi:hypothetical protein
MMFKIFRPILLLVIFAFSFNTLLSQTTGGKLVIPPEKASPITIPKFETSPVIDGNLDDEVWKNAAVFKDFLQTEPGDQIPPSKETIAYMGYDEKHLYIAFYCFDEPELIRSTVAKRDAVGGEDYVGVFLDTFDDQRRAYILQFNPLGIQADGIKTVEGMGSDFSLDIVMESKGMIHADGWSVEVKLPFKSLRYSAGKGKFWGVDFWRRINRLNKEIDGWMPMVRGVSELQQLGKITGLNDVSSERTLEIVPSVTFSETGERVAAANIPPGFSRFINRPIKTDLGVSIKYQITPNVTLDAAINPDFAEVEADAPVVRANERFPIFFPEKRSFFLEGIDYFRSPLQVVNTRNIADPDVAVKLTGKVGKNTFGLLSAVDRFPDTTTKAYIGVLRLRRDIGENSNLGLFATQYHFGSQLHNSLFGFDGKFQISDRAEFNFQAVGTHSRRFFYNPDTNSDEYRTGNGIAYRFVYDYTGRNRGFFGSISGRSRYYKADVGFTRRTNTHGIDVGYRLQTEPKPENQLIRTTFRGMSSYSIDESARLQNARTNGRLNFNFQKQFEIDFAGGLTFEKIYEDEFGARRTSLQTGSFLGNPERKTLQYFGEVGAEKTFNKRISIGGEFRVNGNSFDLDFGASERYRRVSPAYLQYLIDRIKDPFLEEPALDPGKGFGFGYDVGIDLSPTDPLTINLGYERTKLTRNDTKLTAFDSNIFSIKSTYQFTRFLFTRARWDYETIDGTLSGQMLFGYTPNPGTAFYVGYNENLLYRGFNEFNGKFDPAFRRNSRTFFIRASYLFRKSF